MSKTLVLSTLLAAMVVLPLATTSSHAATCGEELSMVQAKYRSALDNDVRDRFGAKISIGEAQQALAANNEQLCRQYVTEAETHLMFPRQDN